MEAYDTKTNSLNAQPYLAIKALSDSDSDSECVYKVYHIFNKSFCRVTDSFFVLHFIDIICNYMTNKFPFNISMAVPN